MIDLRDGKFGTTSSLLISPKAIKKLHDMYEAELTRGAQMPPDLFLWQHIAQNNLRAACIFPFITSLRLEYSLNTTMPGRYDQLSILARDIVRVSFFVDRDLNVCREYIAKYLALPNDPHLQILLQVLGFSFTDKFIDI
jgi:hypothetical protein